MGENVLHLAGSVTQALPLRAGRRVFDLGCGRAVSSIFMGYLAHSIEGWRWHWQKTGLVDVERAEPVPMASYVERYRDPGGAAFVAFVQGDFARRLGTFRMVARRTGVPVVQRQPPPAPTYQCTHRQEHRQGVDGGRRVPMQVVGPSGSGTGGVCTCRSLFLSRRSFASDAFSPPSNPSFAHHDVPNDGLSAVN